MNRMALGLAVGAGYVLGRTKKVKMALAVGSLVAGRRLNLSPKAIGDAVSRQLRENPQLKEIGDQVRQDLGGVGRAASGAMVERRLDSLADRLHDRTARTREQLAGSGSGEEPPEDRDETDGPEEPDETDGPEGPDETDEPDSRDEDDGPRAADERPEQREERPEHGEGRPAARRSPAGKEAAAKAKPPAGSSAGPAAKHAAGSRTRTATAKRTTAAGKPAAKKTAGARRGAEGARRLPKGGGDR